MGERPRRKSQADLAKITEEMHVRARTVLHSVLHTLAIGGVTYLRCFAILQNCIFLGKLFRLEKLFVLMCNLSSSQLSGSDKPRSVELREAPVTADSGKHTDQKKKEQQVLYPFFGFILVPEFFLISLKGLSMCWKKRLLFFWHNQKTFQFILLLNYILGMCSSGL